MMKHSLLVTCALLISMVLQGQSFPSPEILKEKSPGRFRAEFMTTKGPFIIEVERAWSPLAADRLYQLIRTGFYRGNAIFRVQKGYVVQFGISDSARINAFWEKHPVPDEPVRAPNLKGTLSYARDGKDSRTTQLFINLKDNYKLDTVDYNGLRGFPPVARVITGFAAIDSLYGGYGFAPSEYQDSVMVYGNSWLKAKYPLMDFITGTRILKP